MPTFVGKTGKLRRRFGFNTTRHYEMKRLT